MKRKINRNVLLATGMSLGIFGIVQMTTSDVKTPSRQSVVDVEPESGTQAPEKISGAMKNLELRTRALASRRNAQLAEEAQELQSVGGYSKQQLEHARDSVNEMISVSGTIYTQKLRGEILHDLLKNPGSVGLLQKVLEDLEFAHEAFGEDQGKMRHFAVEALSYIAKSGDVDPLKNTLATISNGLARKGEAVDTGEVEDLTELVIALASHTPAEEITMESIVGLGYSDDMPEKIANAWKSSLFIGTWKRSGDIVQSKKLVSELFTRI